MHCTDGQLMSLMDAHVVHEDPRDEALAIAHLEECDVCRQRLQSLSGEGDWLKDLLQSVRKETGEFDEWATLPQWSSRPTSVIRWRWSTEFTASR